MQPRWGKMLAMTNRRLLRWSLLLVILAVFAVGLEPTRVVWGWLRGEAFYQGRPTSWWAQRIAPWRSRNVVISSDGGPIGSGWRSEEHHYGAEKSRWSKWIDRFQPLSESTWPTVLDGDESAASVLRELLEHPDSMVRDWASEGLRRVGANEAGPVVYRFYRARETNRRVPGEPPGCNLDSSSQLTPVRVHGGVGP
jgi:hypothetical protein